MTNSEFYDLTYELKWECVDSECGSYDLNAPLTKFKIWMDDVDGTKYLVVSGKLNTDGTWALRCRKLKWNEGSHFVKNTVSDLTAEAINDVIEDWFESNASAKCMMFDDYTKEEF